MKFKDFRHYFSSARINRYLSACANNRTRAKSLYKSNLKIAQAFHPLLGILEVIIRNRINDILSSHFGDADWIMNQKKGFMIDPSLNYLDKKSGNVRHNQFLLKEVEKAERRLRRTTAIITSGKIIAEQNFSFWTDLFEVHHYKILKGKPIQIFKPLPTGIGRKEVCDKLTMIRLFRNRIHHNEPICFKGNSINFESIIEVYNSIKIILEWIDPELINWIKDIDKINRNVNIAKRI